MSPEHAVAHHLREIARLLPALSEQARDPLYALLDDAGLPDAYANWADAIGATATAVEASAPLAEDDD